MTPPTARRSGLAAASGLALIALAGLSLGWRAAMLSYLAAWLVLLALPVGAIPLVIAMERFAGRESGTETALLAALRRLLALMPVAGLLALPVLACLGLLYPWARGATPATPLAAIWLTPAFFAARLILFLGAWLWLARRLARLGGIDARGAILGIGLHAVVGTLLVTDLVASLDHRLGSSLMGLLILISWSGLAAAVAVLLCPAPTEPARAEIRLILLVVPTALWAFLHFVQFLIVWSANLPDEVLWYFARGGWSGRGLAILGGGVALLGAVLTLRPGPGTARLLAWPIVALHAAEMFWFVTPALRDRFVLAWTDILALAAVLCLAVAALPVGARLMRPGPAAPGRAAA
ncbi:hypothetical protein [Methylobacterium soli]|uniref:Uncharacterized protein n=1 Tax=Methylobacterium soli TaxID=553447 RepID=A0A6L3T1U8_9HYPH|nr:hypothetical protein [Methylobacterium soli]KAB1078847.1 hypothetical protein F6X53_12595 [Methylobacterium soli]GJE42518.1 hypothetical protein AEGHOMDF_1690 [Methylobacterium soli]